MNDGGKRAILKVITIQVLDVCRCIGSIGLAGAGGPFCDVAPLSLASSTTEPIFVEMPRFADCLP